MLDRFVQSLDFQGNALLLRAERQRVIASNIANADTPGYKARDFPFAQAMDEALGASQGGAQGASHPRHLPLTPVQPRSTLGYAQQTQPALDNNSVDMDRERANFMDNAVRYEATLRFINGKAKTLLSAIQGQ